MNFIRVTNASTGKMATINPAMIGSVQDRSDDRYPKTKAAIILNDNKNSFIPTQETEDEIFAMIEGSNNGRRGGVIREEPPINQNER